MPSRISQLTILNGNETSTAFRLRNDRIYDVPGEIEAAENTGD